MQGGGYRKAPESGRGFSREYERLRGMAARGMWVAEGGGPVPAAVLQERLLTRGPDPVGTPADRVPGPQDAPRLANKVHEPVSYTHLTLPTIYSV